MGKGRGGHTSWATGLLAMENYRGRWERGMPRPPRARLCSFCPSSLLPPLSLGAGDLLKWVFHGAARVASLLPLPGG